jgi:SWI/SNF related-matrix-associated actin-dependent regulator of chromatin subfamily C
MQPHQPAPNSSVTAGKPYAQTERIASGTPAPKSELNMEVRRNVYEPNGKEVTPSESKKGANGEVAANGADGNIEESLKEEIPHVYCHNCGTDCTRVRWHHSKSENYDVCPQCFIDKRFAANQNKSEFIKMENKNYSIIPDRDATWTDEELLLLLEGLELYDEDWNKICDHVSTKTREECVLKFLQLEIEDAYVEPDPHEKDQAGLAVAYLGEGQVPFSNVENPVLSVLTYLAGLADPSVVAAAAGRAVEEVQRGMRERINSRPTKDQKGKEKAAEGGAVQEAEAKKSGDGDAMEVELATQPSEAAKNQAATVTALPFALAAARAAALASHEERTITRITNKATNMMLQKQELKIQQFNETEEALRLERKDVDRRRLALFMERLEFQTRMKSVEDALERALALPPTEALRAVGEAVRGSTRLRNLGVAGTVSAEEVPPPWQDETGETATLEV